MPQIRKWTDPAERQRAYRERQRQAREEERAKKGLPPAPPIPTMPGTRRWHALIHEAILAIETARQDMDQYWQDRTKGWQDGEKGQALEQDIEELDQLADQLAEIAAHHGPELQRQEAPAARELPGQTSIYQHLQENQ